jgi:hypothetical protein
MPSQRKVTIFSFWFPSQQTVLAPILTAMNGNTTKKNRNSSQMRNKALPVPNQPLAHNPFTPSLDAIPAVTQERQAKAKNKQQSKVMLGMPDIPIDEHLDNDVFATKIGGVPVRNDFLH